MIGPGLGLNENLAYFKVSLGEVSKGVIWGESSKTLAISAPTNNGLLVRIWGKCGLLGLHKKGKRQRDLWTGKKTARNA